MKDRSNAKALMRFWVFQLTTSVFISLVCFITLGSKQAWSALLGACVAILPAGLFAKKMFCYHGAKAARQIVKSVYLGEALKLLSSIVLFSLVFYLFKITPVAFFLTYILVLLTHWLAPLFFVKPVGSVDNINFK